MNETRTNEKDGFIGKQHTQEVAEVFGADLAKKIKTADENTTFLNLVFEGFAQ